MPGRDYRQLIVWEKAMDFVELLYRTTALFPKEELYGLTAQMRRAAVSIPSNIAEGQGRDTAADFVRFLSIARGSVKEVETQVLIARRLGYINVQKEAELTALTDEMSRLITGLKASLSGKTRDRPPP
ncbi:MAG: four helix bundle protein [Planctomycetota bacterium]